MSKSDDLIAELTRRIEALEAAQPKTPEPFVPSPPQPRYDPTANFFAAENMAEMAAVCGDRELAEIVRDLSKPPTLPLVAPETSAPPGSGFVEPRPLEGAKHTALIDHVVNHYLPHGQPEPSK